MKKILAALSVLILVFGLLCGCDTAIGGNESTGGSQASVPDINVDTEKFGTDDEMFTERDRRTSYDENECVSIELKGTTATASSDSVKISDGTVTITEEAIYIITGTLENGMIIVDAKDTDKLQIVLNGVNVTNKTSAALYILEADKVFVTLADGTENTLANGGEFTAIDENNIDGAIFSKQDLTFNGSGSLGVTSLVGHGIVCKDDLVITGGSYSINCASHGFDANDSVRVTGETKIKIDAGKDGIHCENSDDASLGFVYVSGGTLEIEAEGDGVSAGAYLQIENGSFDMLIGGGSVNGTKASSDNFGGFMGGGRPGDNQNTDENSTSMKGIKSESDMIINGGTFSIDSADDAVHSNTSLTVNGGDFEISSGDDAFHAEENLLITAGNINVSESYEGLEALHIEVKGGNIKLTSDDDGLNAAGGNDSSGEGGRDGMFGRPGGGGGPGGNGSSNGSIVISGGTLYVKASGDGIDANGTLTISGGHTTVAGPTQGDTATLDFDVSAVITGGTFIGTGGAGMAQTFSDSEQGVISVSAGRQNAGANITLKDKDGNVIISYEPELSFAVVILSSPDIISGESYTITVGSTSKEFKAS